jgi:hypothetical protein
MRRSDPFRPAYEEILSMNELSGSDRADALPIVLLPGNLHDQDRAGLAALRDTDRAQQREARRILHAYVQQVLDDAEAEGRTWISDARLTSWANLHDLTGLLLEAAED